MDNDKTLPGISAIFEQSAYGDTFSEIFKDYELTAKDPLAAYSLKSSGPGH